MANIRLKLQHSRLFLSANDTQWSWNNNPNHSERPALYQWTRLQSGFMFFCIIQSTWTTYRIIPLFLWSLISIIGLTFVNLSTFSWCRWGSSRFARSRLVYSLRFDDYSHTKTGITCSYIRRRHLKCMCGRHRCYHDEHRLRRWRTCVTRYSVS